MAVSFVGPKRLRKASGKIRKTDKRIGNRFNCAAKGSGQNGTEQLFADTITSIELESGNDSPDRKSMCLEV